MDAMSKRKNAAAVALGRLGGKAGKDNLGIRKGLAALSPERRQAIAAMGVIARRKKLAKNLQPAIDNTAL